MASDGEPAATSGDERPAHGIIVGPPSRRARPRDRLADMLGRVADALDALVRFLVAVLPYGFLVLGLAALALLAWELLHRVG